ncbi:MAG: hypothetical protein J07HQX50_01469, partial [Haloquadratum sp. J07HQX50]
MHQYIMIYENTDRRNRQRGGLAKMSSADDEGSVETT